MNEKADCGSGTASLVALQSLAKRTFYASSSLPRPRNSSHSLPNFLYSRQQQLTKASLFFLSLSRFFMPARHEGRRQRKLQPETIDCLCVCRQR